MGVMMRAANRMVRSITDSVVDHLMSRMLQEPYTENLLGGMMIMQKLTVGGLVEAGMRAETGKPIERPLGSPLHFSPWESLLFSPVHLFRMPTQDGVAVNTGATIGPRAKKPLTLDIPIMITGMSYGGALSKRMKIALAKGASKMGTATNSGESPLVAEERAAAKHFIGQYNRGGWMSSDEALSQLDAIEIQLGQGAQGSAPQRSASVQIGEEYREIFHLKPREDAVIHSRLPGVDDPDAFVELVNRLREKYGVPVGLKIAATHYLEREMEIAVRTDIDFVVIDGAEGGTHGGPTALQDDLGLPTLMGLARAAKFLESKGKQRDVSLIAAGGLYTPGQFLKALALGADAVYIGSIALVAALQTQMMKALPGEPPSQVPLYLGKYREDLDVDEAAQHLAKFLHSSVREMQLIVYSMGKTAFSQVDRSDLIATHVDVARYCRVQYGGFSPEEQGAAFAAYADRGAPAGDGVFARYDGGGKG